MSHKMRVSEHVQQNLRERWEDAKCMSPDAITALVRAHIELARKAKQYAMTPGGMYFFIHPFGQDGYAVVSEDNCVKTVLLAEWCPEVTRLLERKAA